MRSLVLLLVMLVNSSVLSAQDVRQSIDSRNIELAKAFNSKDLDALSAFYDEGFTYFPKGSGEAITDRQELELQHRIATTFGKNFVFETLSLEVSGDLAHELGKVVYTVSLPDGIETITTDNYLVIWKRGTDGNWYYHVDVAWGSQ